jgi:hypothetical protein
MTEKAKRKGRPMPAKSALFKKELADLKPLLPTDYADWAHRMFPELNPEFMRYAVAGRKVYWEGMPAFRILAGKEPIPEGIVLTPPQSTI